MRTAALDLGSNTFLLLIADIEDGCLKKILVDEAWVVRLFQDVGKTGRFQPAALERAQSCLQEYSRIIQEYGVHRVQAVATSAVRDAENKQEFLKLLEQYKIPVELISGEKEASLTFAGALSDYTGNHNEVTVIDVGGGSTEFIGSEANGELKAVSVDVGSVRLTEKFISRDPVPEEELKQLTCFARARIEEQIDCLPKAAQQKVMAVAGTPATLTTVMQQKPFESAVVHGQVLRLEAIERWVSDLAEMNLEQRRALPGMPPKRADVLVAGATILVLGARALGVQEITVSTRGVRYGVLLAQAH